jgi:hypothetical protein
MYGIIAGGIVGLGFIVFGLLLWKKPNNFG